MGRLYEEAVGWPRIGDEANGGVEWRAWLGRTECTVEDGWFLSRELYHVKRNQAAEECNVLTIQLKGE